MQSVQTLAQRISLISESSTMKVAAEADRLRREGVDVVDFSAGEPDFPTPDNVKRAAIKAIEENFTKYTPVSGTVELKQAICDHHKGLTAQPTRLKECIANMGGKHAIFNLTQALLDPGDEVIIPVPYWVTYKDVVNYAGGKCVFAETDEQEGFTLKAATVERGDHAQDADDHSQLAVESERGGVRTRRAGADLPRGQGPRHLDYGRRVL